MPFSKTNQMRVCECCMLCWYFGFYGSISESIHTLYDAKRCDTKRVFSVSLAAEHVLSTSWALRMFVFISTEWKAEDTDRIAHERKLVEQHTNEEGIWMYWWSIPNSGSITHSDNSNKNQLSYSHTLTSMVLLLHKSHLYLCVCMREKKKKKHENIPSLLGSVQILRSLCA